MPQHLAASLGDPLPPRGSAAAVCSRFCTDRVTAGAARVCGNSPTLPPPPGQPPQPAYPSPMAVAVGNS